MQYKIHYFLGKRLIGVAEIEAETTEEARRIAQAGKLAWREPTADEIYESTSEEWKATLSDVSGNAQS